MFLRLCSLHSMQIKQILFQSQDEMICVVFCTAGKNMFCVYSTCAKWSSTATLAWTLEIPQDTESAVKEDSFREMGNFYSAFIIFHKTSVYANLHSEITIHWTELELFWGPETASLLHLDFHCTTTEWHLELLTVVFFMASFRVG